jgi:glycosyltransferase involved in cell wall biosynthesis
VDVFLSGKADYSEKWLLENKVALKRVKTSSVFLKTLRFLLSNGVIWRIYPEICLKVNEYVTYKQLSKFSKALVGEYDFVFCVDATGAFSFSRSALKGKLVYVSLEVLELSCDSPRPYYKIIKAAEVDFLKRNDVSVLIQDKYRKAYFEQTLGYRLSKVHYLPNTVRKENSTIKKGHYFHDIFQLDKSSKIVLTAGMISEPVCSLEIAEVIGSSHSETNYTVVFHERLESKQNSSYHEKIRRAGKGKVLLSLKPVPFDELPKIFSSADIGMAIYSENAGDNYSIIGSASGKLFQYLKYGLPVIVNNLPGLSDLVKKYEFGIVIESLTEIPGAIEKIFHDYETYSSNAKRAFEEELHIGIYLDRMAESLVS